METIQLNGFIVNTGYKDILINNGLVDFFSIYNYHSDRYFTKNPLRNVVSFSLNREMFYLKRHKEKYWIFPMGNSPAKKEWDNIEILNMAGFKTMEAVAYGQRITRMGTRLSFIITRSIEGSISLEKYLQGDFKDEKHFTRQQLIKGLASLAKRFHGMGYCHQDFYAGHIFLKGDEIYIIDVQRVLIKKRLRNRWRIKDIAQLNYSLPENIVSNTDRLRFLKYYLGIPELNEKAKTFIRKVQKKTDRIAEHTQRLILKGRFNY